MLKIDDLKIDKVNDLGTLIKLLDSYGDLENLANGYLFDGMPYHIKNLLDLIYDIKGIRYNFLSGKIIKRDLEFLFYCLNKGLYSVSLFNLSEKSFNDIIKSNNLSEEFIYSENNTMNIDKIKNVNLRKIFSSCAIKNISNIFKPFFNKENLNFCDGDLYMLYYSFIQFGGRSRKKQITLFNWEKDIYTDFRERYNDLYIEKMSIKKFIYELGDLGNDIIAGKKISFIKIWDLLLFEPEYSSYNSYNFFKEGLANSFYEKVLFKGKENIKFSSEYKISFRYYYGIVFDFVKLFKKEYTYDIKIHNIKNGLYYELKELESIGSYDDISKYNLIFTGLDKKIFMNMLIKFLKEN